MNIPFSEIAAASCSKSGLKNLGFEILALKAKLFRPLLENLVLYDPSSKLGFSKSVVFHDYFSELNVQEYPDLFSKLQSRVCIFKSEYFLYRFLGSSRALLTTSRLVHVEADSCAVVLPSLNRRGGARRFCKSSAIASRSSPLLFSSLLSSRDKTCTYQILKAEWTRAD